MIDLNILEEAAQQQSIQQAQQSSIAQKAAESAQQPDHYPEDVQGILDEIKAAQERDAIRRRIAVYNYACGGNIHAAGGGIHIDPSKRGTFTAAASRHGMGVQAFASKVLANKGNYSPAMVKKANFARNAAKWHHAYGGNLYGRGGTISHQEGRIKSILDKYLSNYRITSAYRGPNNKVGKLGNKSAHAHLLDDGSSAALDIVSNDMNRLRQELANPMLQKELAAAGFGILDETDPTTMKRTGATGAHFHIGQGINGGGFQLNGYGYQPADAGYAQGVQFQPIDMSSSPQQQAIGPWWSQNISLAASQDLAYAEPETATQAEELIPSFKLDWNLNVPSYPNLFAKGGGIGKVKPLYDELIAANVPHNLAIGPVSNIMAESSGNPSAKNSVNGGHFGYLQNDRNITNHIKKYYGGYGHAEQMQFLKDGLTGQIRGAAQAPWLQRRFDDYKRHMHGVTDPSQAALIWERDYEKSANEALGKRAEYARQLNAMLGNPNMDYAALAGDPYANYAMLPSVDMSANSSVTTAAPWWIPQQNLGYPAQSVEAEPVQQTNPFMPTVEMFDLGWDPVNGRHEKSGTYPKLFANGGYLAPVHPYAIGGDNENGIAYRTAPQDMMDTFGYRWATNIDDVNLDNAPDWMVEYVNNGLSQGRVLVNKEGKPVTRTVFDNDMTSYNYNNAYTEAAQSQKEFPVYQDTNDKRAIQAAKKLWGDNRKYAYSSIPYGVAPSTYINKLDTILSESIQPVLFAKPEDHLMDSVAFGYGNDPTKISRQPDDGRIRAHVYPHGKKGLYNGAPVSVPANSVFIEPRDGKFIYDYNSEIAHNYIRGNKRKEFEDATLLTGIHGLPSSTDKESSYADTDYNEWKTHSMVQPFINWYLNNDNVNYQQFIDQLGKAASYIKQNPRHYPYKGIYVSIGGASPELVEPQR